MNSHMLRLFLGILGIALSIVQLQAEEAKLPPTPTQYVTDTAGVIPPQQIGILNNLLSDFAKQTSTQIVVFVSSNLPENTTLDEYAQALYHSWKIGSKKDSNGALILVFAKENKVRIQTGYSLEGSLPDAVYSRIINTIMIPEFKEGKYNVGLDNGVSAIIKATKGEYKNKANHPNIFLNILKTPVFYLLIILLIFFAYRARVTTCGEAFAAVWFIIKMIFDTLCMLGMFAARNGSSGGGNSFTGGGGKSGVEALVVPRKQRKRFSGLVSTPHGKCLICEVSACLFSVLVTGSQLKSHKM